MKYKDLVKGANRYKVGDNIYDLALYLTSNYNVDSEESLAGIFLLLFSWNRKFYTKKPIRSIDEQVKELRQVIKEERELILRLRDKELIDVDFNETLEGLGITVGEAICQLYPKLDMLVGPTGASKVLHLLLPKLIVMWDDCIRKHYGVEPVDCEDFIEFQTKMKELLEEAVKDFMSEHRIPGRKDVIQEILKLRYKDKLKPITKLIDEYNWATITQRKCRQLRESQK